MRAEYGIFEKAPQFTGRVEAHFARRGQERMPMEDDHFLAVGSRQLFEALAQIQLFGRKEFQAESAYFPKSFRLAEDKMSLPPTWSSG